MLGLVILSAAFHECGHATACAYGGAKPGAMGAGIYIVWPAFYTDVTDAYRLDRKGRLRTDLGGVYFNAIFALATAGVYLATRFEPLLVIVLVQHFQILQQMLPFLRLDGYYILSDLTGVPDLFQRIRPTLRSMLPWNRDERAEELKRWVRVVVTGWVVLLVPVLLLVFGSIAVNAPRIFATAWDSFFVHLDEARAAFNAGKLSTGFVGALQMATLVLPAVGMSYSSSRAGTRAFRGAWRWSEGAPARRLGVVSGTACLLALLGWVWYPNGDYKPIQPGERGTIPGAVRQLAAIPTGRPGLTPERERELGGARFRKDSPATGGTETTDEGPVTGQTTTAETTTSGTATTSETATSTTTSSTTTSATTTTTATEPTTTTTP
jgi:putative peptide zinc metalloprotease protein